MPFGAQPQTPATPAPLSVGSYVYLCDPETPTTKQYRARIDAVRADAVDVLLFPSPRVDPLWGSIGPEYAVKGIPLAEVSPHPFQGPIVRGYQEELLNAGMPAPGWTAVDGTKYDAAGKPAAVVAPATAPPQPGMAMDLSKQAAVAPRAPDGQFSLNAAPALAGTAQTPIQAVAQQQARVLASTPAVPECTYTPEIGMRVKVKPNQNNGHWDALVGKVGVIEDISDGEGQPFLTIELEGIHYDNIAAGRFEPVPADQEVPAAAAPATPPPAPAGRKNVHGVDIDAAIALRGMLVTIRLTRSESPYNVVLDKVDEGGISLLDDQITATWDEVKELKPLDYASIPGAPAPKPPKKAKPLPETLKELDAKRKAEGEQSPSPSPASSSSAAPSGQTPSAPSAETSTGSSTGKTVTGGGIDPATSLQEAVALVQTILGGSKVSRKMIEGLAPILATALEYQKAERQAALAGTVQMDLFPNQAALDEAYKRGRTEALQSVRKAMEVALQI